MLSKKDVQKKLERSEKPSLIYQQSFHTQRCFFRWRQKRFVDFPPVLISNGNVKYFRVLTNMRRRACLGNGNHVVLPKDKSKQQEPDPAADHVVIS